MGKNRNFQQFNRSAQTQAADVFEEEPVKEQVQHEEAVRETLDQFEPEEPAEGPAEEDEEVIEAEESDDDVEDTSEGVEEDVDPTEPDDSPEEAEQEDEELPEDLPEEEPDAPAYPFTEVETWTKEELENYISRPENIDIYHSKLIKAIDAHRQISTDLDRAWTVDECTDFFKLHITPEKTEFGCYLHDVTRKLRRESEWTTAELESWAMGLIRPEGLVTTGGLAVELHNRFKMPIQSVAPEMVIAHYKYHFGPEKGSVTKVGQVPTVAAVEVAPAVAKEVEKKIKYAGLSEMNQTYIEETLKQYIETVRPNKVITEKVGFEAQRQLDNLLHYILKLEDVAGVKSGLDILVKTIVAERLHNPRGVFNDTNAFRFAEGVTLNNMQQEAHRRLLTLFFAFIDGDEAILAQTDVPELIKYLKPREQNLLLGYLKRS